MRRADGGARVKRRGFGDDKYEWREFDGNFLR
jgi:hypothetical protein